MAATSVNPVMGQGLNVDADGHAALNGKGILACWNFAAGSDIPEDYARYAEFLPFLHGWDFRINLPHVQFQFARAGQGSSPPAMVGVEEGGNITTYGHVNNSIWLFQASALDGRIYCKILPSRRDLNGSTTDNIRSLVTGWFSVGSGMSEGFETERPAVAVVGKGIGVARVYVVARGRKGDLYMTSHTVTGTETIGLEPPVVSATLIHPGIIGGGWSEAWTPLGITSPSRPAVSEAFDGKLALAWVDGNNGGAQVQVLTPATGTWGPATLLEGGQGQSPQLIWDGTALNLLFVGSGSPALRHAYALSDSPLVFSAHSPVSSLIAVYRDQFHAIFFNRRLHVVIRQDNGLSAGPVFYTTSTTDPGRPASWSIPSETGISTTSGPRVAWLYEHILAIGTATDGRVRYARKDPNRPGNAQTGAAFADHWLEPGLDIDPTAPGTFSGPDTLTFNGDVYLAAIGTGSGPQTAGLYVVNFSRAAMKQLITQKWGMDLLWGGPGGSNLMGAGQFASATEIPAIGDFDGDGRSDLIKFVQTFTSDGQAPVYMYRNINGDIITPRLWVPVFSLQGDVPMVGDFDGDGIDDIISFVQKPQYNFDGGLIGSAPVWVALSGGGEPVVQMWHEYFSPGDQVPMVGDVNGDGKDDIISFAQKPQDNFDGGLIGLAPVWVALSDGTKFGETTLWHTNFSPKGEIPMVGDFNGDGKDDIVTFSQKPQYNANGSLLGNAPVWVALSDGTKFGASSIWHTFFSPAPEVPQVADLNMDGVDDIVTFLADKSGAGAAARNIYVAFSLGYRFDRSSVWHSDFVRSNQVRRGPGNRVYSPQFGHLSNRTLGSWTGLPADYARPVLDIFAFSADGSVQIATTMGNVPYPAGAPWERYKWFTDKGVGVALFPEWIWERPGHCIAGNHRFAIQGLAGVGGGNLTVSSVRYGGRSGHVLEELGHSLFANCFRQASDPFNLYREIFELSPAQGGIGANVLPGCPDTSGGFLSCRPDAPGEHYFLQLLSRYRLNPEWFRQKLADGTNPTLQANLSAQYEWLKEVWFKGQEFATGPSVNVSLEQPGVPLLPAPLPPINPADPTGPPPVGPVDPGGRPAPGAGCGSGVPLAAAAQLILLFMRPRGRYRPSVVRR